MRKILPVLVALAVLAAACGDGDDGGSSDRSSGEQAVSDAIAAAILADAEPGDPYGEKEARCMGDSLVDELGLDRLLALGISADSVDSPEEFLRGAPNADVEAFIDITLDCVDFRDVFVEGMGADVSTESAECIADGISDDMLRSMAMMGISGEEFDPTADPELAAALFGLVAECLTPEEISNLGG